MKRLVVIEHLFHAGDLFCAGATLDVSDVEAVHLCQTGRARLATDAESTAKARPSVKTAEAAPAPENAAVTPVRKGK